MAWTTKSSRPQSFLQAGEQAIEAFLVLDVGLLDDRRAELLDHRQHALAERRALIGEGHFRAGGVQGLGDAPGNRDARWPRP